MKKIFVFVMAVILVMAMTACGGGEIEKGIKEEIKPITINDEKVINDITDLGLGKLEAYDVDVTKLTNAILDSVEYDIAVEEKEDESIAIITITHFDMPKAIALLDEKATEFRGKEKVIDMEKSERYQTGLDDLNQILETIETTESKVVIKNSKDSKNEQTGSNPYLKMLNAIISQEQVEEFVAAYEKGYSWKFDDKNASQIAELLKDNGLGIGDIQSYDAETDPGEMLGRPGGYTSKANFLDNELQKKGESYMLKHDGIINYSYGGTIEVFETAELAKNRGDYLEELSVTTPYNKYYTYRFCNVVFRVGDEATPVEAEKYANVFYERNH